MNRQTNKTEEKALKQTLQHIEIEHVIKVAPQTSEAETGFLLRNVGKT